MNDDTHPANMDVKRLAPSTASLAGVLSLGAGFMSPAFAVVPPADCVLGQAVTTGSCKLDVNGGGADLTVGVFGTTQSQGYLSAYNSSPMSFLLGSAVVGKPALLKLSAGDSVEASDFVSGASGSSGGAYMAGVSGFGWDAVGATGFVGFRMAATGGGFNYGWLELAHGSMIVKSFRFNPALNGAAAFLASAPCRKPAAWP